MQSVANSPLALVKVLLNTLGQAKLDAVEYDEQVEQTIELAQKIALILGDVILSLPASHWQQTNVLPLQSLNQAINSILIIHSARSKGSE